MIQLAKTDGHYLYVNPAFVVAVTENGRDDACIIWVLGYENAFEVLGNAQTVMELS